MAAPVLRRAGPDQPAARRRGEQALDLGLHLLQLRRDVPAQVAAVAQLLRADALHQLPRLLDQRVQLRAAAHVEAREPRKELGEVADGAVTEDAALAGLVLRQAPGQVR